MIDYLLIFGALLSYLLLYKYAALFILILLTGIGFPIPGDTLLMAVGAFASQGYFNLPLSLTTALVANVLGDLVGYFLMRKYGNVILKKNYHKKFAFLATLQPYIAVLDKYIRDHQRITIFITRFSGTADTIVNFLSGLIPIPFKTFVLYDALGNLVSISCVIALGFFVGESWQTIAGIVGTASTIIFGLLFATVIILVIKKVKKPKIPTTNIPT